MPTGTHKHTHTRDITTTSVDGKKTRKNYFLNSTAAGGADTDEGSSVVPYSNRRTGERYHCRSRFNVTPKVSTEKEEERLRSWESSEQEDGRQSTGVVLYFWPMGMRMKERENASLALDH